MEVVEGFLENLWAVVLEASPWLLVGLVVSGLIKAWLPTALMSRWLGGRGVGSVVRAAVIGTPLPLCSCSVIPAAVTLRRGGASKGATVSFLIATPENGADSIALSYALLGPFLTVVRPVAALVSAIGAGVLTSAMEKERPREAMRAGVGGEVDAAALAGEDSSCCARQCCCEPQTAAVGGDAFKGPLKKLWGGMRYAAVDLLGDILPWLALGLVLAAVINTLVPAGAMAQWGSGLGAMVGVLLIGVPMYICATASTPVAAAMLLAGVSPGTVLVFLLAGPATNLGTIGIVRRELGGRSLAAYLLGVTVGSLAMGLVTDWVVRLWGIDVVAQAAEGGEMLPEWLAISSAIVLGLLAAQQVARRLARVRTAAAPAAARSQAE
jgi:hypothetical protein